MATASTSTSAPKILAGTSGYSYKGWKGTFYPESVASDNWLSYYASQLPTVEINNTFYRMPKDHVVQAWHDAVPAHFRFVIKASRRITHQHRLKNAEESTGYLLKRAAVLGDKLGAVLFQLPPYMKKDSDRLAAFLDLLPADFPAAFEFRHKSWFDTETSDMLTDRGHTLVISHDDDTPARAKIELPDSPLLYVRLRATKYTPAALKKWHARISEHAQNHAGAKSAGKQTAFVYFKHEDAGMGPKLAAQFLSLSDAVSAPREPAAAKRAGPKRAGPKQATAKTSKARSKKT